MSSLRESFTLLNKRLQQQLGHLGTENTKLNGSLTIVNEKNSKLQVIIYDDFLFWSVLCFQILIPWVQERLSVIGERNLAITSEFDILRKLEEAEAAETTPLSLEQEQEEMMAAVVSHGASFSYPQGGYKDQQASTSWADMSDPKAFDPLNSDLVSLAQTFHGSRLIQAKLDDESDENKFFFECFFNQCKNRTYEIMTNKFGRFAFGRKLFFCCLYKTFFLTFPNCMHRKNAGKMRRWPAATYFEEFDPLPYCCCLWHTRQLRNTSSYKIFNHRPADWSCSIQNTHAHNAHQKNTIIPGKMIHIPRKSVTTTIFD